MRHWQLPGGKAARAPGLSFRPRLEVFERRDLLSFLPAVPYTVGGLPIAVAVADVNGDRLPDLVVANYSSDTVSVLLGKGDGTFADAQSYTTGVGPWSVTLADLNGDGILDVVTADPLANSVSVLLGNGDGSFQPPRLYAAGPGPYAVAAADLNGDGLPDLAVADNGSNTVSVLPGNGDGTFADAQPYAAGPSPTNVVAADFNGDGLPDLAVTNLGTNTVSVLLGNGDGSFASPVNYAVGNPPYGVAVGDFNGDGVVDLAVTGFATNGTVAVFLGNGDGTFGDAVSYAAGPNPYAVAVGDFNGDGIADLAVCDDSSFTAGAVTVLVGQGDGSFQNAGSYPVGPSPASVAVGDFNGDNFPDLVAGDYGDRTVSVLLNAADWDGGAPAVRSPSERPAFQQLTTRQPAWDTVSSQVAEHSPQPMSQLGPTSLDLVPKPISPGSWAAGSSQPVETDAALESQALGKFALAPVLDGWGDPWADELGRHGLGQW